MKVLVVVDMQNDFIDGALGTKEAAAIVPYVKDVIESFDGKVYFTRDTHFENYMETQEEFWEKGMPMLKEGDTVVLYSKKHIQDAVDIEL